MMKAVVLLLLVVAVVYGRECMYTASNGVTQYDFTNIQTKTFTAQLDGITYYAGAGCHAPAECGRDSAACFVNPYSNMVVSIAAISTAQWADNEFGSEMGAEVTYTSNTPCSHGGNMKTSISLFCAPELERRQFTMTVQPDGCYTSIIIASPQACPTNSGDDDDDDYDVISFVPQTCEAHTVDGKDQCNAISGCLWCETDCVSYVSPAQWTSCGYSKPDNDEERGVTWFWYVVMAMAVLFVLSSICTCIKHFRNKRKQCKASTSATQTPDTEALLLQQEEQQAVPNSMPFMVMPTGDQQFMPQVPVVYYVPANGNGQQMYMPMIPQMMVPQAPPQDSKE